MEVSKVLHMNGAVKADTSYASNSLVQRKVISMNEAITEEAITDLCMKTVFPMNMNVLCIADLGCSSGPNTFLVPANLLKTVENLCRRLGYCSPEFHVILNDLPGNDFNSIFQSFLPRFHQERPTEQPCLVSAVPGTFYGRLFRAKSLHFVHSSYSLMWLSKVPDGVEMNKNNIYMASSSPTSVINAYYGQFQTDFLTFLKCRSEEVVSGGKMVLTILGRKNEDPSSRDGSYIWELLAVALQHMVSQGLIEEEKLHSFHIPQYIPSPNEVATEVIKEGSFIVDCLRVSEIRWAACCDVGVDYGYDLAKCMRSVAESLLIQHFGESIIDELFKIYRKMLEDCILNEDPKFINVTASLTKRY